MRLTEQQRQKAEQWRYYATKIAGRYWRVYGGDRDEWVSEGMVALLRATVVWDASRGATTWVSCLWHQLRARLNNHRRTRHNAGIKYLPRKHPVQRVDLPAEKPRLETCRVELADLMGRAASPLDDREREVLRRRYSEHCTLEQVGVQMGGVTKERVRQIEGRALRKMATVLAVNGVDHVCV